MRVLIVGGTGFIGRHVARALDAAGCEVTVLHRGPHDGDLPGSVRHVRDESAAIPVTRFPDAALRPAPDVVVHMVPIGEADARAAVEAFRGVARRLVAVSSGDVYRAYGRLIGKEPSESPEWLSGSPGPFLPEDAPLRTTLYPYGREVEGPWGPLRDYEKILVERAVLGEPGLPGTVLRLPKVYGPGDPRSVFLPYLKRMDDGRPAILLGYRQARWRWTHGYVEDVAAAIALAAMDERAAGRVYNVGELPTPTLAARVLALGRVAGWQGRIVTLPDDRLPAHLRTPYGSEPDLAYDTARIRTELGYRESVSPEEALARTVAWERGNAERRVDPAAFDYAAEDAVLRPGVTAAPGR
ncbi:MAG TPA: NAD-dependent epimerase/dehydratase family protein [Gemmatimonadota bacterium]